MTMKSNRYGLGWILITAGLIAGTTGCARKVEVPPVVGLAPQEATEKLKLAGFTLGTIAGDTGGPETQPGRVLRQEPPAGKKLAAGAPVQIVVDNTMMLPVFVGYDHGTAKALAAANGLRVIARDPALAFVDTALVVAQEPPANTRVPTNTVVQLELGKAKGGGAANSASTGLDKTVDAIEKGTGVVETITGIIDRFKSKKDNKRKTSRTNESKGLSGTSK
jgi:beta-lactam-binding protein with PASTA domain